MLPRLRPPRTNMSATAVFAVAGSDGDDVGVVIDVGGHDLLRLDRLEVLQLVAHLRGFLEVELLGGRLHAPRELDLSLVVAALEHLDRRTDVARIVLFGDQPDAGRRAALDLVLQAGTRAVGEIGVVAVAQAEQLLQLLSVSRTAPADG